MLRGRDLEMITTQKLHSILRKGGLRRSESSATRVRGWHHFTEGYNFIQYIGDKEAGIIRLEYRDDGWNKNRDKAERRCLESASKILTEAGIKFERKETDYSKELVINLNQ